MIKQCKLIVPDTFILEFLNIIQLSDYFRRGFDYHNLVQNGKTFPLKLTRLEYYFDSHGESDMETPLAKALEKEVEPYFSLIDYIHYTLRYVNLIHRNGSITIEFEIL